MTRYDVAVGETYVYETIAASDFCMDEQFIYYVSRTDGGCVYACGKDGGGKELISDIPASRLCCRNIQPNLLVFTKYKRASTLGSNGDESETTQEEKTQEKKKA